MDPVTPQTPIHAAGVLVVRDGDGRVLALRHRKKYHRAVALPMGKVDDGETPLDAAVRETREETGYTVEILDTVPHLRVAPGGRIAAVYRAKITGARNFDGTPSPEGDIFWANPEDLVTGYFGDHNADVLQHFGILLSDL